MSSEEFDWLARLYDQHAPSLFRAAFSWTRSRVDAEDAVQDVFAALAKGQVPITNERAYLFTSLRNLLIRRLRHPTLTHLPVDLAEEPDTEADEELEQAMSRLPAEQREVVVLKVDGELTFAEIAEVLGISANTAASRYRYALEKLRADLEGAE